MNDILQLLFVLFVVVPVCWCILYLLARLFFGTSEDADLLEENHNNASYQENQEELKLLTEAMQYPQGSQQNTALHARLTEVEKRNKRAWNGRVQEIVKRYPTEQELDELARGINPYKKSKGNR